MSIARFAAIGTSRFASSTIPSGRCRLSAARPRHSASTRSITPSRPNWTPATNNWPRSSKRIIAAGVRMRSFAEKEPTLEDVFMMVTKGLVT